MMRPISSWAANRSAMVGARMTSWGSNSARYSMALASGMQYRFCGTTSGGACGGWNPTVGGLDIAKSESKESTVTTTKAPERTVVPSPEAKPGACGGWEGTVGGMDVATTEPKDTTVTTSEPQETNVSTSQDCETRTDIAQTDADKEYKVSQRLSDRDDISDEDKELFRRALKGKAEDQPAAKHDRVGGQGVGSKTGEMVAAFTCEMCGTRSVKRFSKHCYLNGVVIIQCPGCAHKHLIADHLGWFEDDGKTLEEILKIKGETVKKIEGVHID